MIKDIKDISKKSKAFIRAFINNCEIEEKIDAHYINVEIISKDTIKIKKSNNKEIDRTDLILNRMWGNVLTTWNYIKIANYEWFNSHIGYTISMFYFPTAKPISIQYKPNVSYLIDRITYNNEEVKNIENLLKNLKFFDNFNVKIKQKLKKSKTQMEYIKNLELTDDTDYTELFMGMIDDDNICWAEDIPEGYIFKWKKNNYQILFSKPEKIEIEKSSYEFLLCDFIAYTKNCNYIDKIGTSYVKSVCALFNDYILNYEKINHNVEHNINPENIKNPYLGDQQQIGYDFIPDSVTENLCKESELYENIFKVLLANLRKGKDDTHCIYMNRRQVADWNMITKNIKVRTLVV